MQTPATPSIVFLVVLLGVLPWLAMRSARRLEAARRDPSVAPFPSREAVWSGTLVLQGLLFALAWITGRGFGFRILDVPALRFRDVAAAAAALAIFFVLPAVSRALRSEEERRTMTVYLIAPRTRREWTLWGATVLVASVAEEAAYRGVGMSILWYSLGDPWIAALVCAVAFALAHSAQGWKSGAIVFGIALVMHGLVALTGTLVLAMVVHAVYDLVAGSLIAKEAAAMDEDRRVPR
jgi:membrane protease YdiL (CAAX protease family)